MGSPECHFEKVLSTAVGYSLVGMVRDICRHLIMIPGEHGIQCVPCFSGIICEMLSEIHTMEKCDFLRSLIHSQIIKFSVESANT